MSLLQNPYIMAALIAALVVAVWKVVDQWRDARQKKAQEVADRCDELGLLEFPAILKAYARDDHEEVVALVKALGAKLTAENGVIDTLATVYERTIDKVLDNPRGKSRVQPLIVRRLLGFILDDKTQADLIPVAIRMGEFGMRDSSALVAALGANNVDSARAALHTLVQKFRDPDGIDDVLMAVAEKAIPKLLQDEAHATKLRALVAAAVK